jgi:hypothetical protein
VNERHYKAIETGTTASPLTPLRSWRLQARLGAGDAPAPEPPPEPACFQLSARDEVVEVLDAASAEAFGAAVAAALGAALDVAFDAEWRPDGKGDDNPPSLVQVAVRGNTAGGGGTTVCVWLVDTEALGGAARDKSDCHFRK